MCELWDIIEKNNLKIIGVLQREEKEGWQKASLKKNNGYTLAKYGESVTYLHL